MKKLFFGMILVAFFSVTSAWAWEYGIAQWTYLGTGALWGTVPYEEYTTNVASLYNDANETMVTNLDLYYGDRYPGGEFWWSLDEGDRWHLVSPGTPRLEVPVAPGETLWIYGRIPVENGYHILSVSPWGLADSSYCNENGCESYYWAFAPFAHYYDQNWQRDIEGYVIVALEGGGPDPE